MKSIEKAVYAARGNEALLKKLEEKLTNLLALVQAFRGEVRNWQWVEKNLRKGARS